MNQSEWGKSWKSIMTGKIYNLIHVLNAYGRLAEKVLYNRCPSAYKFLCDHELIKIVNVHFAPLNKENKNEVRNLYNLAMVIKNTADHISGISISAHRKERMTIRIQIIFEIS